MRLALNAGNVVIRDLLLCESSRLITALRIARAPKTGASQRGQSPMPAKHFKSRHTVSTQLVRAGRYVGRDVPSRGHSRTLVHHAC